MRTLKLNDVEFSLPGTWNEMTTVQLLVLSNLLLKDGVSVDEIKVKMLFTTMEAHVSHNKPNGTYTLICRKHRFDLTLEDVSAMASIFDFLFVNREDGVPVLQSKLTKNPFRVLPCKCSTRLKGAEDGLADLTYEQAIEAESYLFAFNQSKNVADLHKFVSALYHTGERFDVSKLENNAKKFVSHASPAALHLVHLFWLGCMDFMTTKYPNCFSQNADETEEPTHPFDAHRNIIYKLAGGDIVKETAVEQSLLHRVYHVLEAKIEEDEQTKIEIEKLKRR